MINRSSAEAAFGSLFVWELALGTLSTVQWCATGEVDLVTSLYRGPPSCFSSANIGEPHREPPPCSPTANTNETAGACTSTPPHHPPPPCSWSVRRNESETTGEHLVGNMSSATGDHIAPAPGTASSNMRGRDGEITSTVLTTTSGKTSTIT